MMTAQYSPDGERVALAWSRPALKEGVWVVSLRDSSQIFLTADWDWPIAWSRDGRSVYTLGTPERESVIRLVPLNGGPQRVVMTLPMPNSACALVGGSQPPSFVCMIPEFVSDVWLIEHFDPAIR
jgi:hypothetical protein